MSRKILVFLTVFTILATVVCADDSIIPPWRGSDGSTYQNWQFNTDATAPDQINNPYGSATADITVGDFGSGWLDQMPGMGTKTGYWDLGSGGTIILTIPNSPIAEAFKEIWIQVTYFADIMQAPEVSVPGAVRIDGQSVVVESVDTGGAWMLDQSIWRMEPNPRSEQIVVTSDLMWGSVVDQIVVDTRCAAVPEPSSLAALLLGGSGILLRRRFRA